MKVPLQAPPVDRYSYEAGESDAGSTEDVQAIEPRLGVRASQSPCQSVSGPARSLCYALRYGISM